MSITAASFGPGGAASAMQSWRFDALIARMGVRVSWLKGHGCPCTFGGGGANGYLPLPGSAARSCKRCLGLSVYWDAPSIPFVALVKFVEMSPTPDEPGARVDQYYGTVQLSEPSMTIPHANPYIPSGDPAQPTAAWNDASFEDIFVPVDMLSRFTAKLQVGGIEYLPYQQNLQIAPTGAVTVWNPTTMEVETVSGYMVSGASVSLGNTYPPGTAYMVEFQAAPTYVAFRPAGGVPHVRPFGAGTTTQPRRFKLQALDFWTRQRGQGPQAPGSVALGGVSFPQVTMLGAVS
jgi:hypothetical protein